MNTNNDKLFSDFSPVTKQEWIEKVNTDLKGEDFNRKLVWKNLNDLNFQPFYDANDALNYVTKTGANASDLTNYRAIDVTTASQGNKDALQAINEGVTGLVFKVETNISVIELLEHININSIAISFKLGNNALKFAIDFFAYVEQNITESAHLKGFIDLGLISNYLTKGSLNASYFEVIESLIKLSKDYINYKTLTISGTAFLDSGSNQVQEIAYTLNALVFVLEQLSDRGMDIEPIFNHLHIELAVGSEYFIEIAKFRALNSLLHAVSKTYGVTDFKHTVTAKTSIWSKSVTDAHTNLLRATTEAMSAILGNVDGVLIDAYDNEFNAPSPFSKRIAGNISTILKEESYFGKVANPVDGAYYIEEATTKISEKALALFKSIEALGGFYNAFENEIIQQQIAEIRQEKIKRMSQRRLPMVGVNKYPNLMEKISATMLSEGAKSQTKVLVPRRASLEIEAIRKTTEVLVEEINKRPIVELASFGNLTMRKARAAFSYDFLGVSGFEVWQEKNYESAQTAAKVSATSNSDVVVICSSDPDYEASALTFVQTFRSLNSEKVLLLAGNPVNILDALKAAGLDDCIHMKSDVIQTIAKIQKKVQKNIKALEV